MIANHAIAKYCVKLPTCEELGYIYSADKYPNNRSIKCPFDTKKILLLDYCQAYGLTSCDSTSGECDECIVEKADGTKSNSGYWRYTRCNAGYSYKSGECPPTEVDTSKYPFTQGELNEEIGEVECVQSAQNIYCGYKSCNEGWNLNSGNCIVHDCGSAYPYTTCDANGTCEECKSGTNTRYSEVTCNSGYYKINGICTPPCSTVGTCKVGDIYAYNTTPIGVVFYNDSSTTKIIALTDINESGEAVIKTISWGSGDLNWSASGFITGSSSTALTDMNGRYNTTHILNYLTTNNKTSIAAPAVNSYAPSTCRTGSMCAKGNWYLPAAGELWSTCQNYNIINNAIEAAGGNIINRSYWSSTEQSTPGAWIIAVRTNCDIWYENKSLSWYYVRPALLLSK